MQELHDSIKNQTDYGYWRKRRGAGKGIENIYNKIIAETSQIWREMAVQVQEASRTLATTKVETPQRIIVETLSIENKEWILKAARENYLITY
jgi:hypothetical protein